ncbi:MAG: phosphotransferase [Proteobacteria bacterium]|nr:phosphotransferase [Pseudomonadota bacterium]MBI3498465.1 phosphotransferase [Pseudomonadota bacterium]
MAETRERSAALQAFLEASGWGAAERRPLAEDASFRRYERLERAGSTVVLMDAPPPMEDVRPYLAVARRLDRLGYSAPAIIAEDTECGFLLIEDFGDDTYTRVLAAGSDERALYALAVDLLIDLNRRPADIARGLPRYEATILIEEALLLIDWYMPAIGGPPPPASVRQAYRAAWMTTLAALRPMPTTLVLRDYHVDNLMVLADRGGLRACGLLDFQDAVAGPIGHDLVSLLEDARRDVPASLQQEMFVRYLAGMGGLDREAFAAAYAVQGAQRNLRIVGVFARLSARDGKGAYLRYLPRLWRLIAGNLAHPALAPVALWFREHLPPTRRGIPCERVPA